MDRKLLEAERFLKLKGYSLKTIKVYLSNLKFFFGDSDEPVTRKSIERYIINLINSGRYSENSINQIVNSIHFYTKNILKNTELTKNIYYLKKEKKLPTVLTVNEVKALINSITNIKHKVIFTLIYSSGLRVGEAVVLKPESLDLERDLIHIKRAKGKRDRYTLLSKSSKQLLLKYMAFENCSPYLFPGQKPLSHLSIRSVQQIMHRKVRQLNINKHVTVHTLRHSFATHLLEQGTDIRYIQEILGHKNIKTTEIYTHVALTNIRNIKNPLDIDYIDEEKK